MSGEIGSCNFSYVCARCTAVAYRTMDLRPLHVFNKKFVAQLVFNFKALGCGNTFTDDHEISTVQRFKARINYSLLEQIPRLGP